MPTPLNFLFLCLGAYLAAAISGAAGFGGALLLLPLLSRTVGPALAVPLLTVAQFAGNLSRAALGFRQIRWKPVGLFLCAALPAAALGALCFVRIPKETAVRLIGLVILLLVTLRLAGKLRLSTRHERTLLLGGGATGFLSGLVGSSGPLGAAVFLTLELPPVAYIASEATTALAIHAVKAVIYEQQLRLPASAWLLAAAMGVAMILGTWSSKTLIKRIPPKLFTRLVLLLLILVSLHMIFFG